MLNSGVRPTTSRYLSRKAKIEADYGEGAFDHSWIRLENFSCYLCGTDTGPDLGLAVAVRLDQEEPVVETVSRSRSASTSDESETYGPTDGVEKVIKREASAYTLHSLNCFALPSVYYCRSCRNLAATGGSGTKADGEPFTLTSPESRGFTNKFLDQNFALLTFVENGVRWSITDRLTPIDPLSGSYHETLLLQQLSLMAGNNPAKLQSIRRLTGRFEQTLADYTVKISIPMIRNLLVGCPTEPEAFYRHLDPATQIIQLTIQLMLNYPLVKRFIQRTIESWAFNPFNADGRAAFTNPIDVRLACVVSDYPFEAVFQSHRKLLVAEVFDQWDPSKVEKFTDLDSIIEAIEPEWRAAQPLIAGDYLTKMVCKTLLEDGSLGKLATRLRHSGGLLDDRLVEPFRVRYQMFVADELGEQVKMMFDELFEQLFPLSCQTETAVVQLMNLMLEVKRSLNDWEKIPLDTGLSTTLGQQYIERTEIGGYHVIGCGGKKHLDRIESTETDEVHLDYPTPHPIDGRPQLHHRRCLHDGCGATFSGGLDLRKHLMSHKTDYRDNLHQSHAALSITPKSLRGSKSETMSCPALICDQSGRRFTVDELIDHFTILGHPNFWRPGIKLPTKTHEHHRIADPEESEEAIDHHRFTIPPIREMAECSLCLEKPANMTAFPCGHSFICRDCYRDEYEQKKHQATLTRQLLGRMAKSGGAKTLNCFFCHKHVKRMQTTAVSFSRPTV